MIKVDDEGYIFRDNKLVGYIGWHNNTICDVFVDKSHRRQGIATEAVSQVVRRLKPEYNRVNTTTVLNTAMEKVLLKNNFQCEVKKSEPDIASDISNQTNIPKTEEEVIWYKNI